MASSERGWSGFSVSCEVFGQKKKLTRTISDLGGRFAAKEISCSCLQLGERLLSVSVVRNFRWIMVSVRGYFIEPNVDKFRVMNDENEHIN